MEILVGKQYLVKIPDPFPKYLETDFSSWAVSVLTFHNSLIVTNPSYSGHSSSRSVYCPSLGVTVVGWDCTLQRKVLSPDSSNTTWIPEAWLLTLATNKHLSFLGLCDICGGINLHQSDCSQPT